ncbi:hypothetical protein [Nocardia rhamnosiphila]
MSSDDRGQDPRDRTPDRATATSASSEVPRTPALASRTNSPGASILHRFAGSVKPTGEDLDSTVRTCTGGPAFAGDFQTRRDA